MRLTTAPESGTAAQPTRPNEAIAMHLPSRSDIVLLRCCLMMVTSP